MDDQHFDNLVRSINSGLSRRKALRSALGGLVAAAGVTAAAAETKKGKAKAQGKKKNQGKKLRAQDAEECPGTNGGNKCCPAGSTNNTARIDAKTLFGDPLVAGCKLLPDQTIRDAQGNILCTCKIEACLTADKTGIYLGPQTTCTIARLIVKGGSEGANECNPQTTPICVTNPNGGGQDPNVSNVTFCGGGCPSTTTTQGGGTTTTQGGGTTTTQGGGTTTTQGGGTTTTQGGGTTTTQGGGTTTTAPCVDTCPPHACGKFNCKGRICGGCAGHKQWCVLADDGRSATCKALPSKCQPNGKRGLCCSGYHKDGVCCDANEAGATAIVVTNATFSSITSSTAANSNINTVNVPPTSGGGTTIITTPSVGGAGRRKRRRRGRRGGRKGGRN